MKSLYLSETAQKLLGRPTSTIPLTQRGKATQSQAKPNSWRKSAAQILISLILLLVMQGMAWGQAASATWSLNSNANASPSGNITATPLTKGSGLGTTVNYGTSGAYVSGWTTSSRDLNDYYEYSIAPASGYNLTITNISFLQNKDYTTTETGAVYYSIGYTD